MIKTEEGYAVPDGDQGQETDDEMPLLVPTKTTQGDVRSVRWKKSWADYIADFEICCEFNGWNLQEKDQYLSVRLSGPGCQVMGTLPAGCCRDHKELVRALGTRFNPENFIVFNCSQKTSETLPELGQQIRTLVAQAYPGANAEVLDVLGRYYFIDTIYLFIWGFTSLSTLYRSFHDG